MKKVFKIMIAASMLSSVVNADFLRVEMGGGVWQNDISGSLKYENMETFNTDMLGYSSQSKGYLWIFLKHPIPIVPNIRLEYADVEFSGASGDSFQFAGYTFGAGTHSVSRLEQYDAILYYNLLDNLAWMTLDLGLDIKYIDAAFNASGSATLLNLQSSIINVDENEALILPMGYGRVRFELPGTGLGVEGDMKYIKYSSSSMLDYRIKADYTFIDILPVDIGVEIGYRFQNMDFQVGDLGSLNTAIDVTVDGVFAGAVVRF